MSLVPPSAAPAGTANRLCLMRACVLYLSKEAVMKVSSILPALALGVLASVSFTATLAQQNDDPALNPSQWQTPNQPTHLTREQVQQDLADWRSAGLDETTITADTYNIFDNHYQQKVDRYAQIRMARMQAPVTRG